MTDEAVAPEIEVGVVRRVERLGALVEISVQLPRLARSVRPGQFAQLRCGTSIVPLLRRPFSVAWVDGEICAFVFEEVGAGTRLLAALQPGDSLDILGPLGTAFTVERPQHPVVCVSGGVGCAPFPLLIKRLLDSGASDITVLSGASTAARLYPAERFQRGDSRVRVLEATDDGTRGNHGRVPALLDSVVIHDADVYACGPNLMLASLASTFDVTHIGEGPVREASLEAPMGCGFGTCLGCALPVRGRNGEAAWALCCTDGPVMRMCDVDWRGITALPGADVA